MKRNTDSSLRESISKMVKSISEETNDDNNNNVNKIRIQNALLMAENSKLKANLISMKTEMGKLMELNQKYFDELMASKENVIASELVNIQTNFENMILNNQCISKAKYSCHLMNFSILKSFFI